MSFPLTSARSTAEVISDGGSVQTCLTLVRWSGRNSGSKKLVISLIGGVAISYIAYKVAKRTMRNNRKSHELNKLREVMESERNSHFEKLRSQFKGEISKEHLELLSLPFEDLRLKLQSRRVTAKDVLEAFFMKALVLSEKLNCVTEFLPDAFEIATKLDNRVLVQGPLHGIPFCVNEDVALEGSLTSFSCSKNWPTCRPSPETAAIVKILQEQGAIPFCRTSTSLICLAFGGRNPYFGEIHNPLNTRLSVGGSSCGTACLVQAGGAMFGIGTDRAGGARVPAHFTGITTIKPTRHRVSRRGCVQHCVGTTSVPCIMAKRVQDVVTLTRYTMEKNQQNKLDPKAVPLPWNMQVCESKQKLRIGYFTQFPAYPPLGDSEEAIKKAKAYLESCGHLVVTCEPPDDLKCQEVWNDLMKVHTHRHVSREDWNSIASNINNNDDSVQISPRVLWVDETRRVRKTRNGDSIWKRLTGSLSHIPGRKSSRDIAIEHMRTTMNSDCDLWNTSSLREQFVDEVLESMNSLNVDVIICPVFGHAATTPENMIEDGLHPGVYTFVWNLLDLPAGVVKVWKESGKLLPGKYKDSIGMPIGIQVVGRPYAEEMVLRVMNELDELNDDSYGSSSLAIERPRRRSFKVVKVIE